MQFKTSLFPLRFLGFGFFWGWLFLVNLSPSPLFGARHGVAELPFEMLELCARIILLIVFATFASRIANAKHRLWLIAATCILGAISTPAMSLFSGPEIVTLSAVFAGVTEVSLFLGWITFFGYMKLGETLLLLAASYAVGAVISLGSIALGNSAMMFSGTMLLLASLAAFVLSQRFYERSLSEGSLQMSSMLVSAGAEDARVAGARVERAHVAHVEAESQLSHEVCEMTSRGFSRFLPRLTAGLFLYSFTFALYLSIALFLSNKMEFGFVVEPTCALALACVCAMLLMLSHDPTRPIGLYRVVPLLVGGGFALLAVGFSQVLLAGAFITFGFLTFELLAYNDYCNIVKADNSSLLKEIARARLASSVGMLIGWIVGFGMQPLMAATNSDVILAVFALFVVLVTVTLVFTDRDRQTLVAITDDQAINEESDRNIHKEDFYAAFVESLSLSRREAEVLSFLLEGRTTSYVAEKLFVAESTIRAHVHNIYAKADVHSRMELMDAFDVFWKEHRDDQGAESIDDLGLQQSK